MVSQNWLKKQTNWSHFIFVRQYAHSARPRIKSLLRINFQCDCDETCISLHVLCTYTTHLDLSFSCMSCCCSVVRHKLRSHRKVPPMHRQLLVHVIRNTRKLIKAFVCKFLRRIRRVFGIKSDSTYKPQLFTDRARRMQN